jgi:oxalate decarboxylase
VNDDIGIVAAFNSLPRDVLAAVFDVPASTFAHIPDKVKPVVITKRQ